MSAIFTFLHFPLLDGSDVSIVALKWVMSLHFPLPKIRTFRFSFTLLVSPFLNDYHCGAEIRNEPSFRCQKFFALFHGSNSNGVSRA